jgi:hypothetical protein
MEKIVLEITCDIALSNASGAIPNATLATVTKCEPDIAVMASTPVACLTIELSVAIELNELTFGLPASI